MNKLPSITFKQQEILLLLYKYRFLNRIQIQTFLGHKYPKRINDWLKDLTQNEYVGRIYSTDFGENTKPAIYFIGSNGIRFLKTRDECSPDVIQRLYKEKNRQESFIAHSLFIADCSLGLLKKRSEGEKQSYDVLTEANLADSESEFHSLTDYDFQLLVTKEKSKTTTNLLFAMFDITLPRYRMRKRIMTWLSEFYDSGDWEEASDLPFPSIYVVCPTKALMIYCKRLAISLLEDSDREDVPILFTYEGVVKKEGITSEIWEPAKGWSQK